MTGLSSSLCPISDCAAHRFGANRRFARDPAIVGSKILLNNYPMTIPFWRSGTNKSAATQSNTVPSESRI